MPFQPSFGELKEAVSLEAPKAESLFRIALLGDFSGRGSRGEVGSTEDIATRRPYKVNRDNLDEVLAKVKPSLDLPVGEDDAVISISFGSLDDFHPDQIHDRVDRFEELYDSDEKSDQMNRLLHHADFQTMESIWRGVDWLLRRALKGNQVEVVLYDVSKEELVTDLKASDELESSGIYQGLIEKGTQGPKGQPWALLIGLFTFDLTAEEAQVLGRMAKIARQTSAPFLSTVSPQVLEKGFSIDKAAIPAWTALRQLPEAALLGLAVPRFLLRLPFGEKTTSIDKFSFEEISGQPKLEQYLWTNPALGCAALLAQSFHKEGWSFKPGKILDLEDLPIHVFTAEDEEEVTLAEAWLNRQMVEQLGKLGFMAFLSVKGKGALQLFRFQSLAQPPKDQPAQELGGRWGQKGIVKLPGSAAPPPVKVGFEFSSGEVKAPVAKAAATTDEETVSEKEPEEEPGASEQEEETTIESAVPEEAPAPAEEEIDPELAALMKEMEGGDSATDESTSKPETPEEPGAEEEMDPELAALMKEMEGGS